MDNVDQKDYTTLPIKKSVINQNAIRVYDIDKIMDKISFNRCKTMHFMAFSEEML